MVLTRDYLDNVLAEMRTHRGDTTDVEVKRAGQGLPSDIGTTICAFANMPTGGLLVLGVSEAGGFSINGVSDPAAIEAGVASIARNAVDPSPYVETTTVDYEGVQVVLARVVGLPPRQKPSRYRGQAYLRQADGDYVMSSADLHMLEVAKLNDTERIRNDAEPVPATTPDDLDHDLTAGFLRQARLQSNRLRNLDDSALLRQLGVVTSESELTVAGLYSLGNYPQGLLPALQVTAAVQMPRDGGNARTQNLRHFDGPLPEMLDELMDWVTANLTTRQEYQANGHLRNVLEMPPRAVREALANALVHRDLSPDTLETGRSIQVRITDRVLTITSPGGLRGLTLLQITSSVPAQAAVNQRLYRIAKDLRTRDGENVIEGEGGGVKEILRATVESDLHRPQLTDNGVQFTANLWRGSAFSPDDATWLGQNAGGHELTHLQKQVLLKARDGQDWDSDSLREEFSPLSPADAEDQLRQLVRWGLVSVDLEQRTPLHIGGNIIDDGTNTPTPETVAGLNHPTGSLNEASHRDADVKRLSKNAPRVLEAVAAGSTTVADIALAIELTENQVRYALRVLESHGRIIMEGGPGHRSTHYRVP